MDHIIVELVSTATIAIALFGASLNIVQTKHSGVGRSFAAFLAAVAVNNSPDAFGRVLDALPDVYTQTADVILWSPSAWCLAPLFWIYVFRLTSTSQQPPARTYQHFVLPLAALLIGAAIATMSPDNGALLDIDGAAFLSGWSVALLLASGLLQMALYPQMAIYLILIVRRMMRYRLLLRDFYASTEQHELRWIYWVGGLGGLFWLSHALIFILALDQHWTATPPEVLGIAGLASLTLVAVLTLWGLRQSPPLIADVKTTLKRATDPPIAPKGEKYEKSALSADASLRIARKLRAAMDVDHLYRDPNLSLWNLARHVGASPNYISQTLSEVIGESFFDFVNGYRIREAMTLLSGANDSVLTITYEVGFNSRSSFYNAFKRVTGQTPGSYRKSMSRPAGMDDFTA